MTTTKHLTPELRGDLARQGLEPDEYEFRAAKVKVKLDGLFVTRVAIPNDHFEGLIMEAIEHLLGQAALGGQTLKVTVETQ